MVKDQCGADNLTTNNTKTRVIVFSNLRDNPKPSRIHIQGNEMESVDNYRHLGATLTSKLSLTAYTAQTAKYAEKRRCIMTKLSHLGISESLRRTAYYSYSTTMKKRVMNMIKSPNSPMSFEHMNNEWTSDKTASDSWPYINARLYFSLSSYDLFLYNIFTAIVPCL